MGFDLSAAFPIWERTPRTLDALLRDLTPGWTQCVEGPDTFSPFEVVGHLVHGERTDWIPRVRIILESGGEFVPFDRFAHREESRGKSMNDLLDEFAGLRRGNLDDLRGLHLGEDDWKRTGRHPALGVVTLSQLLAAWLVHDLGHVRQITRVMAKRFGAEVGPWKAYLRVLDE